MMKPTIWCLKWYTGTTKITRGQAYHVYVNSTSILRHFGLTKPRIAGGKALGDREREREIDLGLVDSG